MFKRIACISLLLTLFTQNVFAIDGFSLSMGKGLPDNLRGGRAALIWDWDKPLLSGESWAFGGFWDTSYAYWRTDGDVNGNHKSLSAFAAAPVFRLKTTQGLFHSTINPYLEGAVGLSYLTHDHLGHRDLGDNFNFEDRIGAGFTFGEHEKYSLGYDFLHYSNADLFPPNNGIDVKVLLTFAYRF